MTYLCALFFAVLCSYAGQLCPLPAPTPRGVGDQHLEQWLAFLESSGTVMFFLLDPSLMSVLNLARLVLNSFSYLDDFS